jgi:hypothetical protein
MSVNESWIVEVKVTCEYFSQSSRRHRLPRFDDRRDRMRPFGMRGDRDGGRECQFPIMAAGSDGRRNTL